MSWGVLVTSVITAVVVLVVGAFLSPYIGRLQRQSRRISGETGVSMHVIEDPAAMDLSDLSFPVGFFFPDEGPVDDPPDDLVSWWGWAHRQGGTDADVTTCMITLQADADVSVLVETPILRRDILTLPAGLIRHPEGVGGGGVVPRRFTFDLDGSDPVQPEYSDQSRETRPRTFSMNKGDVERIQIVAHASRDLHSWSIELPLLVEGHRRTLTVTREAGEPFMTAGSVGVPMTIWPSDERRWIHLTPGPEQDASEG